MLLTVAGKTGTHHYTQLFSVETGSLELVAGAHLKL
jgi:hypothetical protein